jgi:hypothetical protein
MHAHLPISNVPDHWYVARWHKSQPSSSSELTQHDSRWLHALTTVIRLLAGEEAGYNSVSAMLNVLHAVADYIYAVGFVSEDPRLPP